MKKILIILACCTIINVANASIKGKGVHFDNSEEFLSAFKNCTSLETIIYIGNSAKWKKVDIDSGNEMLEKILKYKRD